MHLKHLKAIGGKEPNGHDKYVLQNNETRYARFPLSSSLPQAGERGRVSLREFYVNIMLREPHIRRPLAALLVILGAAILFLAPETWMGALLLVLGVFVEVLGIAIKRKDLP